MRRILLTSAVLACFLGYLGVDPVKAQGFSGQIVAEIMTVSGVSRAEAQRRYAIALRGVADTFAQGLLPHTRRGAGAYLYNSTWGRNAGRALLELPGMRDWFRRHVTSIISTPNASARSIEAALRSSSKALAATLQTVFGQNRNVLDFAHRVLTAAEQLTGTTCLTTCTIKAVLRAEATQGGKSALSRIATSIGSRFGTFLEWLSTHTAQRILGVYTIADFTQQQINTALFAFQDEMEAIGDAAEAEAFNNNVRLLMESLKAQRSCLVPGMTLSKAIRQLRRNMNSGGKYFSNILTKQGVESGCRSTPQDQTAGSHLFHGVWKCPQRGTMNFNQSANAITGSFTGTGKDHWASVGRKGGTFTGTVKGKNASIRMANGDGSYTKTQVSISRSGKDFSGSYSWYKGTKLLGSGSWRCHR